MFILKYFTCVSFFFSQYVIGEGNGKPLQYSCLENPMDGGAWWAIVHGVTTSWLRLSDFTFTFMQWRRKWQPTPVFLSGESQEWQSLVGCCLWGRTESDTTDVTEQQHAHYMLKLLHIKYTGLNKIYY